MIKKWTMFLGTILVPLVPLASVLSCGQKDDKDKQDKQESDELTLDLDQIQTPKELISKILEKSNLQYSKNFLDVLKVDDKDNPTKLTNDSRKAFLDYYAKVKPVKVKLKKGNTFSEEAILDLTKEINIIKDEIENNRYVEDYMKASSELRDDVFASIGDPSKASPNISAYIGTFGFGLGIKMLPMRIVSNKAWDAYSKELDDIQEFIFKITSSSIFKSWNSNKNYELVQATGGMGSGPVVIKVKNVKSGELFDDVDNANPFKLPRPKFYEQSSNFGAAFAVALLNLLKPQTN